MSKEKKTYFDAFPNCEGCPVYESCGTMVSSTRLCLSYGRVTNP